ncbi:uncharacterized protein LODBEIA_P53660 [Lodderomyces beijingensis]|uniref:DNA primase n=1 Tax=Lodderomyces beijingensis TaxID=1775926 RepID=A0ABP0ZSQ5_9ASCO
MAPAPIPNDAMKEFKLEDTPAITNSEVNASSSKPSESDMLFYYKHLLPFKHIFHWLSHSPKPTRDFTMREFAYEYRSGAYQRYNAYSTSEDFKKSVCAANPTRFEIGAVYKVSPKERKNLPKSAMKPLEKELVFDIDLTDYDGIRTCCSGTKICEKCWKFIQVGARVIEAALREDFGFEHLVWVFSGRRGAHCWVSDARARKLDEVGRRAVVEYLDILGAKSPKTQTGVHIKRPLHPHVERSFEVLKSVFYDIVLIDQDPWLTHSGTDEEGWKKIDEAFLGFFQQKELRDALWKKWTKESSKISHSRDKWEDINLVASQIFKSQQQIAVLNEAKKDIIIYYLYPRLDVEVSRQMIHLLKSPFCIHPGTGNVCVPFDPTRSLVEDDHDDNDDDGVGGGYGFNPMTAPNLKQLQLELEEKSEAETRGEESGGVGEGDRVVPAWERTSLKPYVDFFRKYVQRLLVEERKGKRGLGEDIEGGGGGKEDANVFDF